MTMGAPAAGGLVPAGPSRILVPALESGEVHVWHARTDELALRDGLLREKLADEEKARADAFRVRQDAIRFLRRRWLLRRLLAAYGADPGTAPFLIGRNGKPSLAGTSLRFSTSSSEGLAVVAVTRVREVGVDVERLREIPDLETLAPAALTDEEFGLLPAMPPHERTGAFLCLWTLKEAFLKGLGTGLSLGPRLVTTRPAGRGLWRVSSSSGPDEGQWTGLNVDVSGDCVASLAIPHDSRPRVRVLALSHTRQ